MSQFDSQEKDSPYLGLLPKMCMAFGSGVSFLTLKRWMNIWSTSASRINSFLVLAGSKTAEIEGISAAGSTKESRRYTALADAELLLEGPSISRKWPLPPLPAGVSPALITHVASRLIGVNTVVLGAGLSQIPSFHYLAAESPSLGPADCLTTGKAMNINRVETLWAKGLSIGSQLSKPLVLSECVPGGTTTALAVLTGLGISVGDLISGSNRNPPVQLKKELVSKGLKAANLGNQPFPKSILAAVGDPFQPLSVGLLLGARQAGQPVLLGGGSQMVAVLAVALAALDPLSRAEFIQDVSIATTSWLVNESIPGDSNQSSFLQLIKHIEDFFEVPLLGLSSGLRFDRSSKKVLKDYEDGFVKEGVGAGAFALLAQINGFSREKLLEECELAVDQLQNTH
ncbi:Nicotinate-nucleotide--dimethylbenzimidazole phosphoribosyltransferase [Prochlorococcus sp. MIT 0602]|nr:Nicotinate-nucleotide--dimethylbenzimidazole phosphoribosyltransferase [Prochlorococcus sp. MIT 0602]